MPMRFGIGVGLDESLQTVLPGWHAEAEMVKPLRREDRIGRALGGTRHVGRRDGLDWNVVPCSPDDLRREFMPRAVAFVGHMKNSSCGMRHQLADHAGQVFRKCWTPSLIRHDS